MTIGDHPDLLATGYLLNQGMLRPDDEITAIEHAEDIATIVVRTRRQTDYEEKLKRKVQTSGCAQGTVFGDLMEELDKVRLDPSARLNTSWLYALSRKINGAPSLYLKTGAIHGCVLCERDRPLVYMEDVGRHNAVDKVCGWLLSEGRHPANQGVLWVSGRAGAELVLKAARARIPVMASVGAPSSLAIELAEAARMTLIGFLREGRLNLYTGRERVQTRG
jgi:FdhD protein